MDRRERELFRDYLDGLLTLAEYQERLRQMDIRKDGERDVAECLQCQEQAV